MAFQEDFDASAVFLDELGVALNMLDMASSAIRSINPLAGAPTSTINCC